MDGSVKRPICSATAGTISAMCMLAPKTPHLYTCPDHTYSLCCNHICKLSACWLPRINANSTYFA